MFRHFSFWLHACRCYSLRQPTVCSRTHSMTETETPLSAPLLKAARALMELTQDQFAELANIGVSTVADFERGSRDTSTECIASMRKVCSEKGLQFFKNGVAIIQDDDVEWIVNDIAELGVKIGERFFFLYKGESIDYQTLGLINDESCGPLSGKRMMYRPVYKREFGECCHPWDAIENQTGQRRLPENFIEAYGHMEDWKEIPNVLPQQVLGDT
jgi:DNA-binding transcriptional regulator YiaG